MAITVIVVTQVGKRQASICHVILMQMLMLMLPGRMAVSVIILLVVMGSVNGMAMSWRCGAVIVTVSACARMHRSMGICGHHNLGRERGNSDHQSEQRQQRAPPSPSPSPSHVPAKPHGSRFVVDDITRAGMPQVCAKSYPAIACPDDDAAARAPHTGGSRAPQRSGVSRSLARRARRDYS
jgi:hypothetical protein